MQMLFKNETYRCDFDTNDENVNANEAYDVDVLAEVNLLY